MTGQPPATAEALSDEKEFDQVDAPVTKVAMGDALAVQDEEAEPPLSGLQLLTFRGEKFPWKGIWFEVAMVSPDAILLKPTDETAGHRKKRQGRA